MWIWISTTASQFPSCVRMLREDFYYWSDRKCWKRAIYSAVLIKCVVSNNGSVKGQVRRINYFLFFFAWDSVTF